LVSFSGSTGAQTLIATVYPKSPTGRFSENTIVRSSVQETDSRPLPSLLVPTHGPSYFVLLSIR